MPERPVSPKGDGERLHAQHRRRFWMLIAGLGLIGFVIGIFSGYFMAVAEDGGDLSASYTWLAIAGIVTAVLLVIYGSWRFFVSVDEVELADNLWGSLIGFYAYFLLLPTWWALDRLGVAPEPDHWAIYASSLGVALAAYAIRKWRSLSHSSE